MSQDLIVVQTAESEDETGVPRCAFVISRREWRELKSKLQILSQNDDVVQTGFTPQGQTFYSDLLELVADAMVIDCPSQTVYDVIHALDQRDFLNYARHITSNIDLPPSPRPFALASE